MTELNSIEEEYQSDPYDEPSRKLNNVAAAIIADVVRRLVRSQDGEEYDRAMDILDKVNLSEAAKKVAEEEAAVVAALYACKYDQQGRLRVDDQGRPLTRTFIQSKVLNLKANPYRSDTAMLLRAIFMDLRQKSGWDFQKCWREIWFALAGNECEGAGGAPSSGGSGQIYGPASRSGSNAGEGLTRENEK